MTGVAATGTPAEVHVHVIHVYVLTYAICVIVHVHVTCCCIHACIYMQVCLQCYTTLPVVFLRFAGVLLSPVGAHLFKTRDDKTSHES